MRRKKHKFIEISNDHYRCDNCGITGSSTFKRIGIDSETRFADLMKGVFYYLKHTTAGDRQNIYCRYTDEQGYVKSIIE